MRRRSATATRRIHRLDAGADDRPFERLPRRRLPGSPESRSAATAADAGHRRHAGRLPAIAQLARRPQPLPDAYRLRVAPDRTGVAESHGGTAETEAAVKAALKWLADNQAADGRWDPRAHGAGKETNVLGRDRQSAGSRADTAMTGLALLAFLGFRPHASRRPLPRGRPPRPGVS